MNACGYTFYSSSFSFELMPAFVWCKRRMFQRRACQRSPLRKPDSPPPLERSFRLVLFGLMVCRVLCVVVGRKSFWRRCVALGVRLGCCCIMFEQARVNVNVPWSQDGFPHAFCSGGGMDRLPEALETL